MKITIYLAHFAALLLVLNSCKNENINSSEKSTENQTTDTVDQPQLAIDTTEREYDTLVDFYRAYDRVLLEWDTPIEEKDISTSFGSTHVVITGNENNPPLVLFHGMNSSSTMWYPNAKALSQHFRIYAVDYIMEPGKSKMEKKITTPGEMCDWLQEVFEGLELEHFSLGGISKGGWMAAKYAVKNPEQIDQLMLLSPAQTFKWMSINKEFVKSFFHSMNPNKSSFDETMNAMSSHPEKIIKPFKTQLKHANKIANFNTMTTMMVPITSIELKKLDMPVLLLIGDDDLFNSRKGLQKAHKHIQNVDTMTVKNSGHFISVDQPEVVNEKIISFSKNTK